jgi:Leucine-rich repeat (LRR) protein
MAKSLSAVLLVLAVIPIRSPAQFTSRSLMLTSPAHRTNYLVNDDPHPLSGMDFFADPPTPDDYYQLRHDPRLGYLRLCGKKSTDVEMEAVGQLQGLRELDLSGTAITATGMKNLKKLGKLNILSLEDMTVTDAMLQELTCLDSLEYLVLIHATVEEAGWKTVGRLRHLKRLKIYGIQITDADLVELSALPELSQLRLSNSFAITDAGIQALARTQALTDLALQGCPGVSDVSIDSLARLKDLNWLRVEGTTITSEGAACLQKALPECIITQ